MTEIIPAGDLPLATPGALDSVVGVDEATSLPKRFPLAALPSAGVSSVALSMPAPFSVSGSPGTGSVSLAVSIPSQTAKTFYAAPNAAGGVPDFRAIEASDIPVLNQNTTGSAAKLTTARSIAIGSSSKSFDGSGNIAWSLSEIGAVENAGDVAKILKLTQAAYDALGTKDAATMYVIVG